MKIFKKILAVMAIILAVMVIAFLALVVYNYIRIKNGDLIKWNNQFYTKEELAAAFPPQYNEAPAQNTPEEVYTTFRQALLDDDIDLALEQISEKSREQYREVFQDKEKLKDWIGRLPENIKKEDEYSNFAYYDLDMGSEYKNTVSFSKDWEGYWKIDSI